MRIRPRKAMCRNAVKTSSLLAAAIALSVVAWPASTSAQVVANHRQPFSTIFFDDCDGEDVQVTAEDHVLVRQQVAADGTPYWDESINTHGVAAGLAS